MSMFLCLFWRAALLYHQTNRTSTDRFSPLFFTLNFHLNDSNCKVDKVECDTTQHDTRLYNSRTTRRRRRRKTRIHRNWGKNVAQLFQRLMFVGVNRFEEKNQLRKRVYSFTLHYDGSSHPSFSIEWTLPSKSSSPPTSSSTLSTSSSIVFDVVAMMTKNQFHSSFFLSLFEREFCIINIALVWLKLKKHRRKKSEKYEFNGDSTTQFHSIRPLIQSSALHSLCVSVNVDTIQWHTVKARETMHHANHNRKCVRFVVENSILVKELNAFTTWHNIFFSSLFGRTH